MTSWTTLSAGLVALASWPLFATTADAKLPELRIEPSTGSSILYLKNVSSQPLTAVLVELVGYPGSFFQFWADEASFEPVPPGTERRIPVSDMTVGAVPDYVKVRAALYADGSSSGDPEKVNQLIERRRSNLETTHELISRLEKAEANKTPTSSLIADLKQWVEPIPPLRKSNQNSQPAINQAATKALVTQTIARLQQTSPADVLTSLRASQQALAATRR